MAADTRDFPWWAYEDYDDEVFGCGHCRCVEAEAVDLVMHDPDCPAMAVVAAMRGEVTR